MKTKGLADENKIEMIPDNAAQFRRLLQAKAASFGSIATQVPVAFDNAGNATEYRSLITQYSSIDMDVLQRNAIKRFGTAIATTDPIPAAPFTKRDLDPANNANNKTTFYERVDAHVIDEWVKNVLDDVSYSTLLLSSDSFTFVDENGAQSFDGTIMLKYVLDELDPTVVGGVEILRKKLEEIRLHQYKDNVKNMITDIKMTMKQILALGKDCESIRRYVTTALSLGPNDRFNDFIHRVNDDIESGTGQYKDYDWKQVCQAAKNKYLNMVSTGEWTAVNSRDAKLIALATEVSDLKKQNAAFAGNFKNSGTSPALTDGIDRSLAGSVQKWRTVKKGATSQVNGKTFYWCPHHKHQKGYFDGLYCLHKPEDHDQWKAKYRRNKPPSTGSNPVADARYKIVHQPAPSRGPLLQTYALGR